MKGSLQQNLRNRANILVDRELQSRGLLMQASNSLVNETIDAATHVTSLCDAKAQFANKFNSRVHQTMQSQAQTL